MAYTIKVRVIQTEPQDWYSVVEKTSWGSTTWSECDGEHTLYMESSGSSGLLRLSNGAGDFFMVALGVHNYKHWCDIVPDQTALNTGVEVHPTFYGNGALNKGCGATWTQEPHQEKTTAKGVTIKVDYYQTEGNDLRATITILDNGSSNDCSNNDY